MSSSELSDVAWDLVEHCRAALSIPELNTAFVRLGVGDYSEAMVVALKSLTRSAGPPLTDQLLARLTSRVHVDVDQRGIQVEEQHAELLAAAPRSS